MPSNLGFIVNQELNWMMACTKNFFTLLSELSILRWLRAPPQSRNTFNIYWKK